MSKKLKVNKKEFFTKKLLEWFDQNHRPLPWKGEKNPYYVWLSEIILQQTRVEQGLPYFEKFKSNYPTVSDLANAPEDEVMKLWEGLGYYSRARNLHYTAKYISNELKGEFPSDYEGILKLKGVGPYTAAAIASFAFDLPHAVVDGNVYRVLSRVFGIKTAIDSTEGKKEFSKLAQELIEKNQPANYNQAIMDFGATHCKPANPNCGKCLMSSKCFASQNDKIQDFPFKCKKIQKRTRFFNYLIISNKENIFIQKRTRKDIWQNLYEFPFLESMELIENVEKLVENVESVGNLNLGEFNILKISKPFKQTLTHQKIIARFWEIQLENLADFEEEKYVKIERKNLTKFAFPKVIDLYLKDKSLTLELF